MSENEATHEKLKWGTLAAGFSAACALVVSAYTAYLQRQQTKAQIYPVLAWAHNETFGDADGGEASFVYTLRNDGVGPATIESVEVTVDGKPMAHWKDVQKTLVPDLGKSVRRLSSVRGRSLAAGAEIEPYAPLDPRAVQAFKTSQDRIRISYCYCSVLEDCWTGRSGGGERDYYKPEPVAHCPTDPVPFED